MSFTTETKESPAFSAVSKKRIDSRVACGCTGDLRLLGEPLLDRRMGFAGAAADAVNEIGAQAFWIVEQNFQDMTGSKLQVPFPQGEILRRLNEALSALGVFFVGRQSNPVCSQTSRLL